MNLNKLLVHHSVVWHCSGDSDEDIFVTQQLRTLLIANIGYLHPGIVYEVSNYYNEFDHVIEEDCIALIGELKRSFDVIEYSDYVLGLSYKYEIALQKLFGQYKTIELDSTYLALSEAGNYTVVTVDDEFAKRFRSFPKCKIIQLKTLSGAILRQIYGDMLGTVGRNG